MKKFQKKKEDFECINCGFRVSGNGYTNHCPKCLYSLHVDNNPGDRAAACRGRMKPVSLVKKNSELKIVHICEKCGYEHLNRIDKDDDLSLII